jgi:hypothetical protein
MGEPVNFETVEKIANAVLYEGYMLYPYRPSSTKNRQRWNFGTLYPQTFAEAQRPPEAFSLLAECLVEVAPQATLTVRARFLHLDPKETPQQAKADNWVEGVERNAKVERKISDLLDQPYVVALSLGPLTGMMTLRAKIIDGDLVKLSIELANVTPTECATREEALLFAFSSAHLLLGIEDGRFLSMLDPPERYRTPASGCHNVGVYPVLVGDEGSLDKMLCSPIILYDYPQVAPESAGDFFDGTEMDEMLSLRVLTMTDEEKTEMKSADARSRHLLERTETLPAEHMMKLHGAIRGLRRVRQQEEE